MALVVKNPPANAGDVRSSGLIPGLRRSPREDLNTMLYICYISFPRLLLI